MLMLIITVVLGLGFALFATQNTHSVDLNFGKYYLPAIPVYLLTLIPLLIGLIASLVIHAAKDLSNSLTIDEQKDEVKKLNVENAELTKNVHKLELENIKLKAKNDDVEDENSI